MFAAVPAEAGCGTAYILPTASVPAQSKGPTTCLLKPHAALTGMRRSRDLYAHGEGAEEFSSPVRSAALLQETILLSLPLLSIQSFP